MPDDIDYTLPPPSTDTVDYTQPPPSTPDDVDYTQPPPGSTEALALLPAPDGSVYVKNEYGLLGTVPVEQASAFTPATQSDLDAETYSGRPIETFARTTGNSALLGIPEALASEEYVAESDKLAEHNTGAAMAGEGVGTLLPMAITGGTSALGGTARALARIGSTTSRVGVGAVGRTLVGDAVRASTKSVPILRGAMGAAESSVTTAVRNVTDKVAHDDEVTLESAMDGVPLSLALGAVSGAIGGKLEAKLENRTLRYVDTLGVDGTLERLPVVAEGVLKGTEKVAGVVSKAVQGVGKAADDVAEVATHGADNLFSAAARNVEETGLLKKVKTWSTTDDTVERMAGELTAKTRSGIDDMSREFDDVARGLDTNPVAATPDELARSIDSLEATRGKLLAATKNPSYADSGVVEAFESRLSRTLNEGLGLPNKTSLDDAVRKGLMVAEPEQSARALGRALYELDELARSVKDPTIKAMFATARDDLGRQLSDGVKLIGSIHEGNAYARALDRLAPGLRHGDDVSLLATKTFLKSNDEALAQTMSDYIRARATTLQLAGRQIPESLDAAVEAKALMQVESAALKSKNAPKTLTDAAMDFAKSSMRSPGTMAGGALGAATGIPGAGLVGAAIGRKLEDHILDRFVKPVIGRMVRSQEARDGIRKAISRGAQVGIRGLRAAGQGAIQSANDAGRRTERRGTQRLSFAGAERRMEALAETMDPGTLRGAEALVQREVLREGGEAKLADAMQAVTMRQSQALAAKTRELLGDGPDPSDPLSHLTPQEDDTYASQRLADYTLGVTEPHAVVERLNEGLATMDEFDGMRDVHPALFQEVVESVGQGLSELERLPDTGYVAYLEAILDADLVPGSLVESQARWTKEGEKQMQEQGNPKSGVAGNFAERSGYSGANKT